MLTTIAGGQSLLSCQFVYDRWHNLHYGPVCERVILAGCFGGANTVKSESDWKARLSSCASIRPRDGGAQSEGLWQLHVLAEPTALVVGKSPRTV
jgi:hypothetical protein